MRYALLVLACSSAIGCGSSPTPEEALVQEAAAALGGAAAVTAAHTLILEGTGDSYFFGQSLAPDTDLFRNRVSEHKETFDFVNRRWRQSQTRSPRFVFVNMAAQTQVSAVDGDVGFNVAVPGGEASRVSDLVARDRQAELLHHPLGFLQAALGEGARLSNLRTVGNESAVDLAVEFGTFSLFVDSATKRPTRVQSKTYNANLGDIVVETSFDGYSAVNGLNLPTTLTSKTDRWVTSRLTVSSQIVNGDVGDLAAPATVRSGPAQEAPVNVTADEIGKGLWLLSGGSHNSVVVELSDRLVLIEAPLNDARTRAVIDKARQLKADKPVTHVVNSHHHFDHSGGVRAAVAEGLTIITHERNKAHYEDVVSRPHTIVPDSLARNPKPISLETVQDKHVVQDPLRTIEIYAVNGSPHCDTCLMVYVPDAQLLVVADLYNSPPAETAVPWAFAPNLLENVEARRLRVARVAPIHGRVVPMALLRGAAAEELKAPTRVPDDGN